MLQSVSNRPLPLNSDAPEKTLAEYRALQFPYAPGIFTITIEVSCIASNIGMIAPFSLLISLCLFTVFFV